MLSTLRTASASGNAARFSHQIRRVTESDPYSSAKCRMGCDLSGFAFVIYKESEKEYFRFLSEDVILLVMSL